jgi:hypothetical protein
LLAALIPTAADAQQDDFFEMVVELRIHRGPTQVIFALGQDTTVLVPLGQFAEIAELGIVTVEADHRFVGLGARARGQYAFVTDSGYVRRGDETRSLDSSAAAWRDGELFVSTHLLSWTLGVNAYINWTELQLVIRESTGLPVVRRLERERQRRALGASPLDDRARHEIVTPSPIIDGAAVDWAFTSSTRDPLQTSTVDVGLGSQLVGGSLNLRYTRRHTPSDTDTRIGYSWMRAWPAQQWLRQAWAGEFTGTGRTHALVRGAGFTNAPFLRPVQFADEILSGTFPEGWEVEVYRNDRLVGFTQVDDTRRYAVHLPVQYGPNPVELVAYGPHGEVVRSERTFEIPFQRLPDGDFEYGVSGGGCVTQLCTAAFNIDARYGLTDHVTAQIGSDFFTRDSRENLWHPYALVSVAATRSLSFTGEGVVNGLARLRTDFAPTPDLRLSASHTLFDNSDPVPLVGSPIERHRTELNAFWRPAWVQDRVFFEANAFRSTGDYQTMALARLAGTLRLSGARLTQAVRYEQTSSDLHSASSRTRMDSEINTVLSGPWRWARGALVGGGFGVDTDRGFAEVRAAVGRQIYGPLRFDLATAWTHGRGWSVDLSLTSVLRSLRTVSRNRYTPDQGIQGIQHLEGSVLWNRPAGRAEFGNGRTLGRAGIAGEVFLDVDGNGKRDPGEPAAPNVRIRIASTPVRTDSSGQFVVRDLVPFERTVLEIDTLSITIPLWVPKHPTVIVQPTPNSFQLVSLPLIEAGEITGHVLFEAGGPVPGVQVVIVNRETGESTEVVTFSDGSFYLMGIRPGRYEMQVEQGTLDRLRAEADPVLFEVAGGSDGTGPMTIRIRR